MKKSVVIKKNSESHSRLLDILAGYAERYGLQDEYAALRAIPNTPRKLEQSILRQREGLNDFLVLLFERLDDVQVSIIPDEQSADDGPEQTGDDDKPARKSRK